MADPSRPSSTHIVSEFAGDRDMAELVELFVGEMPGRVEAIRTAFGSDSLETLKRIAHQLKGSAAGYGFPTIGEAAGKLESSVLNLTQPAMAVQLESLRVQVDQLTDLCSRARSA